MKLEKYQKIQENKAQEKKKTNNLPQTMLGTIAVKNKREFLNPGKKTISYELVKNITTDDAMEILRSFNDEKNEIYEAFIESMGEHDEFVMPNYYGDEIFSELSNKKSIPIFISAFYIDKRSRDYSFQVSICIHSDKIDKTISRKVAAQFNRRKETREKIMTQSESPSVCAKEHDE